MATELHFRGEGGLYRVVDEADGLPVRLPAPVELAPQLISSTASVAVAAAGDYAANDVVSNSATEATAVTWKFPGMAPGDNRPGAIYSASITCSEDDVSGSRFRLFLFNEDAHPATVLADNAALAIGAEDRASFQCYIDFPAMIDVGSYSLSQSVGVQYGYKTSDKLYGILQILDAEADETAGMTITITLHALPI